MKIKTQLNLLILTLILVPLISSIFFPIFHYFSSSQRILLKGYKQIRESQSELLTQDEWDLLKEKLQEIPPNVESAVYYNNTILISSIPELKEGTTFQSPELFSYISSTSDEYDYQLQSPYIDRQRFPTQEPNLNIQKKHRKLDSYIVITRINKNQRINKPSHFLVKLYFGLIVFEVIAIALIARLFKVISSSITLIENCTQKLADGELDQQIEIPSSKRFSNEITSLTVSLEKMRISLKDVQSRKTKFIMGVSHDLRTPVALIKGYTEAITDGVVNDHDTIMKSLSIIHSKADQLEGMINDLIDYVKLNNSEWLHQLDAVEIKQFLDDFSNTAIMTGGIYNRKVSARIQLPEDLKIQMDKKLVTRALENIIANALRYTKDDDEIVITAESSNEDIKLKIRDTGKGISKEDQQHIYDLFYRGTNSRREQGMGIGLSVVKTIIDTHGWDISVDSTLNVGTEFTITIPLQQIHAVKEIQ